MASVAIVTDSTASLPDDIIQQLNINWIPYYIHAGGQVLRDLSTIQRKEFYEWLPTLRELPKTASPGPGDYIQMYQELAEKGVTDIASIHMTSKGSGAFQAATAARDMILELLPHLRIEVIDTLNVSMCHGWMVIEAARAALVGKSLDEIAVLVKEMIPITRMFQTADTLKYLYLGGRIGRAKHLVGSLLNIKPVISMDDGIVVSVGQARSRIDAYRMITRLVEKAVGPHGKVKVAYVHAAARQEIIRLREMVEERVDTVESLICELSPALGVHTGPGTAGLCFYPVKAEVR
jgi:DegV family protein with EDD domain